VALVGLGNLGRAIANYRGFTPSSFSIVAVFDRSPRNVGNSVNGMEILHDDHLTDTIIRERIRIGIISTPKSYAQVIADRMVAGGVEAILNYAPVISRYRKRSPCARSIQFRPAEHDVLHFRRQKLTAFDAVIQFRMLRGSG
jgi:NADH/NAD ratio-sensing transcriptional regulator Rex